MDFWEREYEKIITKDKHSYKEEYIPDKSGFNIFIVIIIILFMLFLLMPSETTQRVKLDETTRVTPYTATSVKPEQTYIDGEGFNNMIKTVKEGIELFNSILIRCSNTSYNLSDAEVDSYYNLVDDYSKDIETLKYHSSYNQYVEQSLNLCMYYKQLLLSIKYNNLQAILTLIENINSTNFIQQEYLLDALDNNGIDYKITDYGLTYNYNQY